MEQDSSGGPNSKAAKLNLIEDFEGIQTSEELLRRWRVSADADAVDHSVAEIHLLTPGAEGTRHAMRLQGRFAPGPKNSQGYVSARCEVQVPANSKSLRGIEFEIRGDSRVYQVAFQPPNVTQLGSSTPAAPVTAAVGPSARPCPPPAISFVPSEAWQNVRVPIAWLANPRDRGLAAGPWILQISVTGPSGEFALDLDEIRFY